MADTATTTATLTRAANIATKTDRLERLARSITARFTRAAFVFDDDDEVLLETIDGLDITDADDYQRGFDLLGSVNDLDKRIAAHYGPAKKFLHELKTGWGLIEKNDATRAATVKAKLNARLVKWSDERDRLAAAEKRRLQQIEDDKARAVHDAMVAATTRLAESETDPFLRESFKAEAQAIADNPQTAAPVETTTLDVPKVKGGFTREYWYLKIDDPKLLLAAWLGDKITLDEERLNDALIDVLKAQGADKLQNQVGKVYPGVSAYSTKTPVKR